MFERVLNFIWDLFESLSSNLTPLFEFLNQTYGIGDYTYSLYEIIFGGGLFIVLGVRITMFIVALVIPN